MSVKHLKIERVYTSMGTFGKLYVDGSFLCHTVEKQWRNNKASVSCVPVGLYKLSPHVSSRFGKCYILSQKSLGVTHTGPSQRTHCLIHPANTADELAGCIAPGMNLGVVRGKWAVVQSRVAFNMLMDLLDGQSVSLEITKQ